MGSIPAYTLAEEVTLEWTPCNIADHYMVYWGTSPGTYQENSPAIPQPPSDTSSMTYTVTGLTLGTTYYFAVKSFNASEQSSDFSDEVSITAGIPTAPVPPDNQTPTSDTSNASIEILNSNMEHQKWLNIGWDAYRKSNNEARVATGDLDGDGNQELIIGLGPVASDSAIPGGFFQIVSHDYQHLDWGQIPWPEYNDFNGETWPACGDLDSDGKDEIVVGLGKGGQGNVAIFSYTAGSVTFREWATVPWTDYNASMGETHPACGDIDGDTCKEIIIGLGSETEQSISANGRYVILEKPCPNNQAQGFQLKLWGQIPWPEYNALNGETWPSCGDIDGDGQDEIILGLGAGGNGKTAIMRYKDNVLEQTNWVTVDWQEYNNRLGETRPACSDVDGDGTDEIVIGLGPVAGSEQLPEGRFPIISADQNFYEWGKVGSDTYNKANGESRPTPFKTNGESLLAVGLGSYKADNGNPTTTAPDVTAKAGGGSGGCFIEICR